MCDCGLEIGDVVVCIDDTPSGQLREPAPFTAGVVYNVSDACHSGDLWRGGTVVQCGILVNGQQPLLAGRQIGNDKICNGYWSTKRFRRVYRPDGSLISKLLEPVEGGVDA